MVKTENKTWSQKARIPLLAAATLVFAVSGFASATAADNPNPVTGNSQGSHSTVSPAPQRSVVPSQTATRNPGSGMHLPSSKNEDTERVKKDIRGTEDHGFWSTIAFWVLQIINGILVVLFPNSIFISVLGLVYIRVPFTRPFLRDDNEDGAGTNTTSSFANGLGGFQQAGLNYSAKRAFWNLHWVPDSALDAVKMLGGTRGVQQNAALSGMPQMGYNPMMGGGMGQLGAGNQVMPQDRQGMTFKSPIAWYVWEETKAHIMTGFGAVVLTSFNTFVFGVNAAGVLMNWVGGMFGGGA